jgi:hypothetical protein
MAWLAPLARDAGPMHLGVTEADARPRRNRTRTTRPRPEGLKPALKQAFASPGPRVISVNVVKAGRTCMGMKQSVNPRRLTAHTFRHSQHHFITTGVSPFLVLPHFAAPVYPVGTSTRHLFSRPAGGRRVHLIDRLILS